MTNATISEKLVVQIAADTSPLSQGLGQAARELSQFAGGTVAQASRSMTAAFVNAFGALAKNASSAAKSGESAIDKMVAYILRALERIALRKFVIGPLSSLLQDFGSSLAGLFSGRATGGAVGAGNAYLVGEHGPELFMPSSGGEIVPANASRARPNVIVNIATPDAQSFFKSQSQVAAMMTRALAKGQRNL